MKRTEFSEEGADDVQINMSPLIDCIFLLLIFFVVTAVFVEETGVDIRKPRAVSARQLEKNSILIAVTADGRVVYGGRDVGVGGVRSIVSRRLEEREAPVIIMADVDSRAGLIVDVIDECKIAGADIVSLAAGEE